MKNALRKSAKLTLSKETLRSLAPQQLGAVQGGTSTSFWCSYTCASACNFCPL